MTAARGDHLSPPNARLDTRDREDRGRDYKVECSHSFTLIAAPPEEVATLGDNALFRITLVRHDVSCGECDTSAAWAVVGTGLESVQEFAHGLAQIEEAAAQARRN
jgi:hypothetical protein